MDLLIYFWLLTLFLFLYNLGRVYFTVVPVVNNWIGTEKWGYYKGLDKQKFLIFLFIIFLSVTFAFIFIPQVFKSESWFDAIYLIGISLLLQMSMTFILEKKAPNSPTAMLKNFINHDFEFKIDNTKEIKEAESININKSVKKRSFQNRRQFIRNKAVIGVVKQAINSNNEIKEIITTNIFSLAQSEFVFEVKKSSNIILSNVIAEYSISPESCDVLKDFLYRNKISRKIIFTKSAKNGTSVKEMFQFFSSFTNIFDMYRDDKLTQAKVVNIMNEIVVGTYKNKLKENPISKDNVSTYVPKKNLGVKNG